MSQKQQSLSSAAENTGTTANDQKPSTAHARTANSHHQSRTEPDSDADPRPELGEIQNLIQEKNRVCFLGLEGHSEAEYPDHINRASPIYDDDPVAFNDVVKFLPEAEESDLQAVNEFVNPDGSVDSDAIADVEDIDLDAISIDPDEISDATRNPHVDDYKDIVDPRRQALAALGFDVRFRWQVASDSYAIINPKDAYFPAYKTFKEKGESETIFGWVDTRDWGGRVNMYLFFTDHTIQRPDADPGDPPIYVGLQTGYDFSGGRAMDVKLFGYDPENDVRFYSLGARRSRRHIGDPNNAEHERSHGRTPIKEWWEKEYENLLVWTDELVEDIQFATSTTIDFTTFEFGVEEFYEHLDIPQSYIEQTDGGIGAVKRAKRHSPSDNTFTMWTLFYSLATTLEEEFQGRDHAGSAFKVYADIATKILRSPHTMIERAKREHDLEQQKAANQNQSKHEQAVAASSTLDQVDSATELDGVSTEDELGLVEKRTIAQDSQKNLFNFN